LLQSLTQELGDVPDIESAHQVEPMDFDRPDADLQCRADLTIGMAQCHQSKDLALAGRDVQRGFRTVSHPMEREGRGAFASGHLSSSQKI
jgi:predicted metal-dependent HD superfamily phosphohydrolase